MGTCYVSGLDEEECECNRCKGKYPGVGSSPLPTFDGLTFEDFCREYLENATAVIGIARADDELMLYEYYKKYGNFVPTLRWFQDGYKHEYSKLEDWFSKRFFKVLRERVLMADPRATKYYDDIEKDFLRFRGSITKIFLDMTSDKEYIGTADINPVLIFLKKAIRNLDLTPSKYDEDIINYADYVDVAGSMFVPGSAMFFLELYALLKDERILQKFQKLVEDMDSDTAKKLVKRPLVLLIPWEHQNEAFEMWYNHGKKGIIEMATATGKTLVGLMAIEALAQNKGKGIVRIFAHSKAILNQWRREVIDKLGLIADICQDYTTPIYCDGLEIHFDTLQRVYKNPENFPADLLIVDEVHHSAAFEFRKALSVPSRWKMGLSATIEGDMKTNILEKEIGPIVYSFSLKEALEKGVLPKFEWKLHTVYLSIKEENEFKNISKEISNKFKEISNDVETMQKIAGKEKEVVEDLYDFVKLLEKARYKKIDLPEKWRLLQSLILRRRWLIHRSQPKLNHAIELAKGLSTKNKVIVFTMDIESCNLIGNELSQTNDNVFVVHSDIDGDVNKRIMDFKNAKYGALIGARMLDEGIDIPDAEIGINVSASKTRLQLVQRMGRILRMQKGKHPIFYHYVAIPSPEYYLHEEDNLTFLDELSWVQDTALKMGVHAELEKEEKPFERLRLDAEEMIRKRYFERKIPTLPGYGTFRLEYILRLFSDEAIRDIVSQLNELGLGHRISDVEWTDIVRKAHGKKIDDPLNIPGYWWILILGDRNPIKIKEIFKDYSVI
jgi:superfamily II DNA or RNA helicase